jgi:hypothetical protein
MSEVQLPVLTKISPLPLCPQSLEAPVIGICSLAHFTSLHDLLNRVFEPYSLEHFPC